ncbi:class I SAM-dependent methyltransferase [Catenulispora yoronensis]|uniref:class I SAM-dependent methyltransferase n=1 Tax=Catenulispora yoronensis TaxID=450799 RepID=UPI0031D82645
MDPASAPAPPSGDRRPSPVAARFDLWSADYESSILQDAFYTRLHHHALHLATHANPAPRRLLDLGCGTGRLLRAAAARFPQADLVGVDISAGMLDRARAMSAGRRCPTYLLADAARLPVADRSVDIVTCTATSHHWPEPEGPLAQLRRVTADDGVLILAHLPGIAPWDLKPAAGARRQSVRTGTSRLTALLGDAGFRITKAALYSECPVMPTTVVLCARPDSAPRPRGVIRLLRSGTDATRS